MLSLNNTELLLDLYDALLQSPVYDRLEPLERAKGDENQAREALALLPEGKLRAKLDDAMMTCNAAGEANGFVIGFRFALSMIYESHGLFSAVAAMVQLEEHSSRPKKARGCSYV